MRWNVVMLLILLAAMMCVVTAGAQPADLSDLPILRGAMTDGMSTSIVNWQGFYIGGQSGYGSSGEDFTRSNAKMFSGLLDPKLIQPRQGPAWNIWLAKENSAPPAVCRVLVCNI